MFAMLWPVLKRSLRSMSKPIAFSQKSQRYSFHTRIVKLNEYDPSVNGRGPSRQM